MGKPTILKTVSSQALRIVMVCDYILKCRMAMSLSVSVSVSLLLLLSPLLMRLV